MQTCIPIKSMGAREAATVAGNAASRILAGPSQRTGVLIHNSSTAFSLWIRLIDQGSAPITISTTDRDYVIPPENTLNLDIGPAVEIYAQNSSGTATTSAYVASEVRG